MPFLVPIIGETYTVSHQKKGTFKATVEDIRDGEWVVLQITEGRARTLFPTITIGVGDFLTVNVKSASFFKQSYTEI